MSVEGPWWKRSAIISGFKAAVAWTKERRDKVWDEYEASFQDTSAFKWIMAWLRKKTIGAGAELIGDVLSLGIPFGHRLLEGRRTATSK